MFLLFLNIKPFKPFRFEHLRNFSLTYISDSTVIHCLALLWWNIFLRRFVPVSFIEFLKNLASTVKRLSLSFSSTLNRNKAFKNVCSVIYMWYAFINNFVF